jgi:hypothetical protein
MLLIGIYDSGNVLLPERILIEKLYSESKITINGNELALESKGWGPMHITQDSRKEYQGEYYKAVDVIDNSLDGQTLTARLSRLELVRG